MGYAPDWNKGSMKKSGATPVKHGVTSRELFHGAKTVQKFADGGDVLATPDAPPVELNIRGEKVGQYEGNDEIAKYRMNMTDGVGGKSLRYKDNPDMMAEKPMPQSRPYDSIDAIIDAKGTKESKSDDGGGKFLATQAAKATTAINTPKTKPSTPKLKNETARLAPQDPSESEYETPRARSLSKTGLGDMTKTTANRMDPSESEMMAVRMQDRMEKASPARKPSTLNVSKYRKETAPDEYAEEAGAGVPSSKRVAPAKPKLYYGKK